MYFLNVLFSCLLASTDKKNLRSMHVIKWNHKCRMYQLPCRQTCKNWTWHSHIQSSWKASHFALWWIIHKFCCLWEWCVLSLNSTVICKEQNVSTLHTNGNIQAVRKWLCLFLLLFICVVFCVFKMTWCHSFCDRDYHDVTEIITWNYTNFNCETQEEANTI